MKQSVYTVRRNDPVARGTFRMVLEGETAELHRPGQFVNIRLDGYYLRRPISVADWGNEDFTVIYKVAGNGTRAMSGMCPGETLDILTGLGNGYDMDAASGKKILLTGGGCGVPPLIGLARRLAERGETVAAAVGFDSADSLFGVSDFEGMGIGCGVATNDGSAGIRGFVTDLIRDMDYDYYFACGPEPMLRAVHALSKPGQLSFEERMGCGFGICMGCSCRTLTGNKRICADGPVMFSEEVRFDG